MAGSLLTPNERARRQRGTLACVLDSFGRSLWLGYMREQFPAPPGGLDGVLKRIIEGRTAYTDGGPALPAWR